jgi:NADH:ubiquinone oxidoreductase subunit 5 (subunit L)/multisubunit Na+/H+ antiporter MnhA subunit
MVHSTFAAACLFLIADLVVSRRSGDTLSTAPPTVQNGLFAALFFAAAIAMAGMPPLSGFLGKLLVLDALRDPGVMGWAWTAILAGSLLTIVGFARAGSTLFWKSTAVPVPATAGDPKDEDDPAPRARHRDRGGAEHGRARRARPARRLCRAGLGLSRRHLGTALRPRRLHRRRARDRQRKAEPC